MKGYSFRSLTDLVLKIFKTKVNAGTGLSGGGSLEADRTLTVVYGTAAGTATQGNDSRVVNAASNATVNAKEAALETKKADKAITITAGTGLSGGGSLEANRTLNVSYGTAAGTAAQGNDNRLSNSREWTAATISQAETEAGTASTRRAFTAQRVRQAIIAWWNSITGAFGRDLVTSDSNSVARSKLGLHTSATRWPSWSEVTSKPTTFSPSSHTHPWNQVTEQPATATRWPTWAEVSDKPANYPTTWNSVAAKPAQATRWPTFAEVTDKPATYAPSSHTHPVSQVTGLGSSATRNVGTASGNVLEVGAFGLGSVQNIPDGSDLNDYISFGYYGYGNTAGTGTILNKPPTAPIMGFGIHVVNTSPSQVTQIYRVYIGNRTFSRDYYNGVWSPWVELLHTGNILSTTGQSTQYPMTQKAVTDGLNTKANTSTQVIAGTGLIGGGNLSANRTLSVNYGTTAGTAAQGNDSRIVNAVPNSRVISAGTGLTGGGNLATNQTLSIAASHTPIGVGQTWQDMKASRTVNTRTTYTNTTGRTIFIYVVFSDTSSDGLEIALNGERLFKSNDLESHQYYPIPIPIPAGGTYLLFNGGGVGGGDAALRSWWELR